MPPHKKKRARKKKASGRKQEASRPARKKPHPRNRPVHKWSSYVTTHSHAMDTEQGIFTSKDPKRIARSLMHSAKFSHTRKSPPYRSAMSMLTFYINRGGKDMPASRKRALDRAKVELRRMHANRVVK